MLNADFYTRKSIFLVLNGKTTQWAKSPKKNSLKECVFVNSALKTLSTFGTRMEEYSGFASDG